MPTSRLEAFSDGVLAIIITILVLELRVPEGHDFTALWDATGSALLTYVLSFVYLGIYWSNHHHLFHLTERISGGVLWANLHLLFWLSLFPFTTSWLDESEFGRAPVIVYGIDLLAAAVAWYILQTLIVRDRLGVNHPVRHALGRDVKGKISPVLYLCGIASATFIGDDVGPPTFIALGFFVAVAAMWLVPDRRMEREIIDRIATRDGAG